VREEELHAIATRGKASTRESKAQRVSEEPSQTQPDACMCRPRTSCWTYSAGGYTSLRLHRVVTTATQSMDRRCSECSTSRLHVLNTTLAYRNGSATTQYGSCTASAGGGMTLADACDSSALRGGTSH
jgi:hypothetical protein